ncbi:MAG: hypothetical protein ACMUIU_18755 [bacterium]
MDLPSLYLYLGLDGANFCLRFSLISEEQSVLEKSPYPFLLISDSDPLTRMVEARFVSDDGSEIKKLFLLFQRDQYLIVKDELRPVTNKNIYEFWQNAYLFYSNKKDRYSFITLTSQIDQAGRLIPFRSLFFCKKTRAFFHPPCPECGFPLGQCYDDEILNNSGLLAYSTSLKRYLYCPFCFKSKGKSNFYVYDLEGSDPPTLKNRWELIKAFGSLVEKSEGIERDYQIENFPCLKCPYNNNCYGPHDEVTSKIVPFSFYPFYMFIFESMSLNTIDFLALVSGASLEELEARLYKKQESGRIHCLKRLKQDFEGSSSQQKVFFPIKKDERSFLEVLYLKLSFLGELIRDIFLSGAESGSDALKHPDMGLSLDHIWIKLPDLHGLLPLFWDFSIRHLDIVKRIDVMGESNHVSSFANIHHSKSLYFLSMVLFNALLVNKEQDMSKINLSLGKLLKTPDTSDTSPFAKILREGSIQTFSPNNIFWDPADKTVTETWHILWEKALGLGWELLNASLNPAHNWGMEGFCQKLDALRDEVKNGMFQEKPGYAEKAHSAETMEEVKGQQEESMENEAIHNILMKIHDKWLKEIKAQPPLPEAKKVVREQEPGETVIISPGDSREEGQRPKPSRDATGERGLNENVVISPGGAPGPRGPHGPQIQQGLQWPQGKPVKPDLEKPIERPEDKAAKEGEGLEKTVVISHGKDFRDSSKEAAGTSQGEADSFQEATDSSQENTDLSQGTADLSQKEADLSKKETDSKGDDFFTETIILTPEQIKEKLNKKKKENNE